MVKMLFQIYIYEVREQEFEQFLFAYLGASLSSFFRRPINQTGYKKSLNFCKFAKRFSCSSWLFSEKKNCGKHVTATEMLQFVHVNEDTRREKRYLLYYISMVCKPHNRATLEILQQRLNVNATCFSQS